PPPPALALLPLHDALPIYDRVDDLGHHVGADAVTTDAQRVHPGDQGLNRAFGLAEGATDRVHVQSVGHDQAVVSESMTQHTGDRSEEHTSELQSRFDLVCR